MVFGPAERRVPSDPPSRSIAVSELKFEGKRITDRRRHTRFVL